jgi:hypothetical protein
MSKEIIQDWLNRTSACFLTSDFACYQAHIHYPVTITTEGGGKWLIHDEDEMRRGFDAWTDMMRDQGATDLVRTARTCDPIEGGDLWSRYSTELVRNAVRIVPGYDSILRLRKVDGKWKCVMVMSGLANLTWPFIVPRVGRSTNPLFGEDGPQMSASACVVRPDTPTPAAAKPDASDDDLK